jgi:hypothetical protein
MKLSLSTHFVFASFLMASSSYVMADSCLDLSEFYRPITRSHAPVQLRKQTNSIHISPELVDDLGHGLTDNAASGARISPRFKKEAVINFYSGNSRTEQQPASIFVPVQVDCDRIELEDETGTPTEYKILSYTLDSLRVVRLSVFEDALSILDPEKDSLEGLLKVLSYGGITKFERLGPTQLRVTVEKIYSVEHSCSPRSLNESHEVKEVSTFSWGESLSSYEKISTDLLEMLSFALLPGSVLTLPGEDACEFLKAGH